MLSASPCFLSPAPCNTRGAPPPDGTSTATAVSGFGPLSAGPAAAATSAGLRSGTITTNDSDPSRSAPSAPRDAKVSARPPAGSRSAGTTTNSPFRSAFPAPSVRSPSRTNTSDPGSARPAITVLPSGVTRTISKLGPRAGASVGAAAVTAGPATATPAGATMTSAAGPCKYIAKPPTSINAIAPAKTGRIDLSRRGTG